MKHIYTIGHSIYGSEDFVKLLQKNSVNTLVDVRSTPYSKFAPQYNKESLNQFLKQQHITYIYMGDMLGARYEDKSLLFQGGKVNFKKVQETKPFQEGISRLDKGIGKGYTISLMCSEKEAFDCHRFGLISEFLTRQGIYVDHIYPDKVVSQQELEQYLLKKYAKKLPHIDLFHQHIDNETLLTLAYEFRNLDIGYNALTKEGDEE